jgi:hypothetical protein
MRVLLAQNLSAYVYYIAFIMALRGLQALVALRWHWSQMPGLAARQSYPVIGLYTDVR